MTNVMESDSRLLLDLKYFSAAEKMLPITKPSRDGEHDFQQRLNEDARHVVMAVVDRLGTPKLIANTIRPTASSSATIGSSRSVNSPFALY